jgi:hypothetical protein
MRHQERDEPLREFRPSPLRSRSDSGVFFKEGLLRSGWSEMMWQRQWNEHTKGKADAHYIIASLSTDVHSASFDQPIRSQNLAFL